MNYIKSFATCFVFLVAILGLKGQTALDTFLIDHLSVSAGASFQLSNAFDLPIHEIRMGCKYVNKYVEAPDEALLNITYRLLIGGDTIEDELTLHRDSLSHSIETIRIHDTLPEGTVQGTLEIVSVTGLDPQDPVSIYGITYSNDLIPLSTSSVDLQFNPEQQLLHWNEIAGADEYEIQWCARDVSASDHSRTNSLPVKVTTDKPYYYFDQVFQQGEVKVSIRSIQWIRLENGDIHHNYGQSDSLSISISNSFEADKNWQYVVSYAEHGKRKNAMTYYDGLYRQRQALTTLSSDSTTLVQDYIFDHEGRSTVEVLPAPMRGRQLGFIPNLSTNQNGVAYGFSDFDQLEASNQAIIDPMGTASGASKYYSPENDFDQTIHRDYIPDAAGYPFKVTQFTNDNTGRPKRASGVGPAFQLDAPTPHYTSYLYGKASEEQIIRLFGDNAGDASKYFRNITVDPNGQASVAYVDQYGRTVATALTGNSPPNLDSLPSNIPDTTIELSLNTEGQLPEDNQRILVEKILKVGTNIEQYNFSYQLMGTSFNETLPLIDPETYCVNCTYDLFIQIIDPSGKPLDLQIEDSDSTTTTITTRFEPPNSDCDEDTIPYDEVTFQAEFRAEGEYTVIKELHLVTEAIEKTERELIEHPNALSFYPQFNFVLDTDNCITTTPVLPPFISDTNTVCAVNAYRMMLDFEPGGRLFEDTEAFQLAFDRSTAKIREYNANLENESEPYLEYQGSARSLHMELTNAQASTNAELIDSLILSYLFFGHPEYCHFEFECMQPAWRESMHYNLRFLNIDNFKVAYDDGYFNPLHLRNLGDIPITYPTSDEAKDVALFEEHPVIKDSLAKYLLEFAPKTKDEQTGEVLTYYTVWEFLEKPEWVFPDPKDFLCDDAIKDALKLDSLPPSEVPDSLKWQLFQGIYQGFKKKAIHRFKVEQDCAFSDDANAIYPSIYGDNINDLIAQTNEIQDNSCLSTCEQKAGLWLAKLSEIECISSAEQEAVVLLYELLKDFCLLGCDDRAAGDYFQILDVALLQELQTYAQLTDHPLSDYLMERLPLCMEKLSPPENDTDIYAANEVVLSSTCREECFQGAKVSPCLKSLLRRLPLPYTATDNSIVEVNASIVAQLKPCLGLSNGHDLGVALDSNSLTFLWSYQTFANNTLEELCQVHFYDQNGELLSFKDITRIDDVSFSSASPRFSYTEPGYFTHITINYQAFDSQSLQTAYLFSTCQLPFIKTQCDPPYVTNECIEAWLAYEFSEEGPDQDRAVTLTEQYSEFKNGVFTDAMGNKCKLLVYDISADIELTYAEFRNKIGDAVGKNLKSLYKEFFFFTNCYPGPLPCTAVPCPAPLEIEVPEFSKEDCLKQLAREENYYRSGYALDQLEAYWDNFYSTTIQNCFTAPFSEAFTYTTSDGEHHYTLYYYDQAGNLVQTVPPAGVERLDSTAIQTHLDEDEDNNINPSHRMATRYWYDSRNQLIKQQTPDGGITQFWYNAAGLLRFSQNADQALVNEYSYTSYDEHARIIETGVIKMQSSQSPEAQLKSFTFPQGEDVPRKEVVQHIYDQLQGADQRNLRNRIARSQTLDEQGELSTSTDYSYDAHGNVEKTSKYVDGLGTKEINYTYDLISGNVHEIAYQKDSADQFIHRYTYDADNRLTKVFTSRDGYLWHNDARYYYYAHGPLARKELGDANVQGMDYVYTLQGWLKGMNANTLNVERDPGKDGSQNFSTSLYSPAAADLYGYTLGYYNEDYTPIGNVIESFEANIPNPNPQRNLFNGNISHVVNAINGMMSEHNSPTFYTYTYDQLNRLTSMHSFFDDGVMQDNVWNNPIPGPYASTYAYDANGNFKTLKRWNANEQGEKVLMDDFTYHYQLDDSGRKTNNRLYHVRDSVFNEGLFSHDLDDQGAFPLNTNYSYDQRGNMSRDSAAGIDSMMYNSYGKIAAIHQSADSLPNIRILYDAGQHRVAKVMAYQSDTIIQYYARDSEGQELVFYRGDSTGVHTDEYLIYGDERLGALISNSKDGSKISYGSKNYHSTNHLGSVILNLTDLISQNSEANGVDYFPYGMNLQSASSSMYGFCGVERENNSSYTTKFRQFEITTGRWTMLDPLSSAYRSHSPYNYGLLNPILYHDKFGDSATKKDAGYYTTNDFVLQAYIFLDGFAEALVYDMTLGQYPRMDLRDSARPTARYLGQKLGDDVALILGGISSAIGLNTMVTGSNIAIGGTGLTIVSGGTAAGPGLAAAAAGTLVAGGGAIISSYGAGVMAVSQGNGISFATTGSSRVVTNSNGDQVLRRFVKTDDELLEVAEKAAGGSLDNLREIKPGWWEGNVNGIRRRIEWQPKGEPVMGEGPHVKIMDWDPSKGKKGGYRVKEKYFIEGKESYR